MTERPHVPVPAIAAGLFCLVLVYLALQIRAGDDPSIGAGAQAATQPAQQVIVRRIVVRRIVEEGAPAGGQPAPGAPVAGETGPAGTSGPAPSAAPAPAPAPAAPPVVSRGS
ncbi:MAG: hypothetical protein QOD73_207 [Solirubrobacteraceae bacterium]|nr:hypothetical protein [Solirubrobacteraceae bacterium]